MANKKMKSLLSNGVMAAIGHDPEIGLYFKRKKEEEKESGIVYNAIKNKLIHRVFAVIRRQSVKKRKIYTSYISIAYMYYVS